MSSPADPIARLFRLDGQVAIVTGGMGRLGSQYVRTLVAAGASVAIFDLPGRGHAEVQQLIADGRPVASYALDAVDRAEVDRAMLSLTARFGVVTVLVNNAGLGASPADAALETALRDLSGGLGRHARLAPQARCLCAILHGAIQGPRVELAALQQHHQCVVDLWLVSPISIMNTAADGASTQTGRLAWRSPAC